MKGRTLVVWSGRPIRLGPPLWRTVRRRKTTRSRVRVPHGGEEPRLRFPEVRKKVTIGAGRLIPGAAVRSTFRAHFLAMKIACLMTRSERTGSWIQRHG